MKNFIDNLKENTNGLVMILFEMIVGILLLINPVGFTSGIIMAAGIVLLVLGIVEIIKYFRTNVKEAALGQTLVKGIVAVLAGGFCAFKTEWFIVTFPVLTIIYGVGILLTGIGKIQMTVDMVRQKNKKWFWAAINAVVSIVCAIVILKSPFTSTTILWIFTGASLIAEGVLDIVTLIMGNEREERR